MPKKPAVVQAPAVADAAESVDWKERCLERLRSEASDTLASLLSESQTSIASAGSTSLWVPSVEVSATDGQCLDVPWDGDAPSRRHATVPSRPAAGSFGLLSPVGAGPAESRLRAYTSATPSDAAREVSAISAEFQRFLASKAEQLRVNRQLGTLSDEQLQDQFMRDVGATLRDIADQLSQMDKTDNCNQDSNASSTASTQRRALPARVARMAAKTLGHVVHLLYGGER